jgi:NAD(P)-dependent dehydrogenase (short-subunit alcohol dehydrogenase family)
MLVYKVGCSHNDLLEAPPRTVIRLLSLEFKSKMLSFANRTVIVTGGAGALGRAISVAFAKAGANVVVNDLGGSLSGEGSSESASAEVVQYIHQMGLSAVADSNSVTEGEKIINTAIEKFGRVDVLINTAAIAHFAPIEDLTPDIFRRVLEVNAIGPMSLIHHAWPHFKKQKYGRVVNFTSDSIFGMRNSSAYVLSKGALVGVNKTLALEGAPHGITVNCAAPCAFSRLWSDFMKDLPREQQEEWRQKYTGESNVPMILALAHEKNDITGKIFSLGAYSIGRMTLGTVSGPQNIHTMEECFSNNESIIGKDKKVYEPDNVEEFLELKATLTDYAERADA